MTTPESAELMSAEHTAALVDFARTCKAAARSVSLYPAEHPAITGALARLVDAARRMTAAKDVTVTVLPDSLTVDGHTPAKADAAIGELAALLHDRLIGQLQIDGEADASDWRLLLLLLGRTPDELIADGGVGKAWAATGQARFTIREIDYAEVLREREGAEGAAWNRILEFCLDGRAHAPLDERAIEAVLQALTDPEKVGELVDRLQEGAGGSGDLRARVAALLKVISQAIEVLKRRQQDTGPVLQAVANAGARMTPEMMLSLLHHARQQNEGDEPPPAAQIVERMGDGTIAGFVSKSVVAEHGATERLALALEALVPDDARKDAVLDLAKAQVAESPLGSESAFDDLWRNAADMLRSYSDKSYVSDEYGRELSGTRTRAIDVERLSDDPPDRVQAWLTTVEARAVRDLDLALMLDLLRIESTPDEWQAIASVAVSEIERFTSAGDFSVALRLLDALVDERGETGRPGLREVAESILGTLAAGHVSEHVVEHLRRADEADVEQLKRMCHTVGASVVRPLAIALAVEENTRAIRRLRELLLSFGAAGRQSVEQLKHSSNPAVRRTAIDLLRVFGGSEALPELASMLDDADPQVLRESIRAIVQIGTPDAYTVLQQALSRSNASRDTILQQLIGLRDDKAVPLLCHVLDHTTPRGALVNLHAQIIDSLGSLAPQSESIRTLRTILFSGTWWAPFRTAALRRAAAAALHRLGSPEAIAVLRDAATGGSSGVRKAARRYESSLKEQA